MLALTLFERPWGVEISGFLRPFFLHQLNRSAFMVCDMDLNAVIRFDYDANWFDFNLGASGWSEKFNMGQSLVNDYSNLVGDVFNGPHGILVNNDFEFLVLCYYDATLWRLRYDEPAEKIEIGECVGGPATITKMGINLIAIADYGFNSVVWLNSELNYLGRMGFDELQGPKIFDQNIGGFLATDKLGGLDRPHMIKGLPCQGFVIADSWNNRLIKSYLPPLELEKALGFSREINDEIWELFGKLPVPVSVDVNSAGDLLVTCWQDNSIILINSIGQRHRVMNLPTLKNPYHSIFSGHGIAVADSHNARVLITHDIDLSPPLTGIF
jgi:hypothetical protein